MKKLVYLAVLVTSSFAAHGDGNATRFKANLVSTEEVPALFEAGTGSFTAEIVANDTQINFTLTYQNLTGNPSAAHVHFGQRSVAGGVSYFFCGGGGKPACPANTSGTVTGSVVAADVVGLTYANMHTAAHPGGEIRGQVRHARGDHDDD